MSDRCSCPCCEQTRVMETLPSVIWSIHGTRVPSQEKKPDARDPRRPDLVPHRVLDAMPVGDANKVSLIKAQRN
ncbi:hypothetical protein CQW39_13410 [Streptomyces griseofuscus]|uniref:hypothetical protein n=1 Tax=Streptomyces griseofuscus TaxID=146922 RepID=UPI000F64748B|nr:hypothetical protein [Streptomyces griseofuscus]RRQ78057.1 hypothetical protein CQW39_13410 [Streptomyces griseofuscus]